ncbi:hypothetical protein HYQ44_000077 [Verticillium longisporum]|nr:hypothetical protein HYQ44_000077 [Verticillium longisporum]
MTLSNKSSFSVRGTPDEDSASGERNGNWTRMRADTRGGLRQASGGSRCAPLSGEDGRVEVLTCQQPDQPSLA